MTVPGTQTKTQCAQAQICDGPLAIASLVRSPSSRDTSRSGAKRAIRGPLFGLAACLALAVAGCGGGGSRAAGRPAALGPKVTVSMSALRGASLPRDAQCSTFVPVLELATVVSARCGSLDVVIDNQGGRSNGCTYVTWIAHEPPYWACHAETSHIKIQSFDFQKALAAKRLQEAIELVLRVSRVGSAIGDF
jgi:hypothetical protein